MTIVSAAVKVGDLICSMPRPNRHHNVLRQMAQHGQRDFGDETQGFLADTGAFLNRRDAYEHALACGQGTPRRTAMLENDKRLYNGPDLYSEDLW